MQNDSHAAATRLWALLTTARDEECEVGPLLCSFLTRRDLFSLSCVARNERAIDNRLIVEDDVQLTELPRLAPFRHRMQLLPGRGWGVICLEEQGLEAGLTVAVYSGEVINSAEARARRSSRRVSPCIKRPQHLPEFILTNREHFQLQGRSTVLCSHVDATRAGGGIARYFNHSCAPNLRVSMYRDVPTPAVLPLPVFQTSRRVSKFDEMTFDYGAGGGGGDSGGGHPTPLILSSTPCHCGAHQCSTFLPACSPD